MLIMVDLDMCKKEDEKGKKLKSLLISPEDHC